MTLDLSQINEYESSSTGIPGVLIDGTFWYWDGEIDEPSITFRHRTQSIAKTFFRLGIIVAVASFISCLIATIELENLSVLKGDTWLTPHASLAAFWFGVLALCYSFFKHRSIAQQIVLIPKPKATPEKASLPSLSATTHRSGLFATLSKESVTVVEDAFTLAKKSNHADVSVLHLFASSMTDGDVRILFARLGISTSSVIDPIRRKIATLPTGETSFGKTAITLLRDAFFSSAMDGASHVSTVEIFAACYNADPFLQEVLFAVGVDHDSMTNALAWLRIQDALRRRYVEFRTAAGFKPTGNMDRAYTAIATPFLDNVSDDLTRDAVYGRSAFCVDRQYEIDALFRTIEGGGRSAVLVGQSGVGKGSIIDGIAQLMVEEKVPDILKDKRLLRLNVSHIVSAQGGAGAEERFLYAMSEVAMSGNIVLVIENIHELVGIGGSLDLSSILASELEKNYTFVIATSTPSGFADKLERSSLGPKLQKVVVDEPDRNLAIRILESHIGRIEHQHNVVFTYPAVAACVDLAMRYLHDTVLPTSAITVAQETALDVSKRPKSKSLQWVAKEDIAGRVSSQSKIPVTAISEDEGQKLLTLESRLHERVIGQESAITSVSSALRRARTELRSNKRPIANFLFLGPTGVGKTELAKTTSEVYFGSENAMVRFDMSEYQDQASIARLIGGNGQTGLLTEAIRKTPFTLLLLDELEKAHSDILNLFLQVMDDGRLTDGMGRTIDFTNVILIATSNAGTQYIQDEVAKNTGLAVIKTNLLENELRTVYRPEFLNRFDDIIVFSPLTQDDVAGICYLMIAGIEQRLAAKGLNLRIDDDAVHELALQGYDPKFGARPLRRVLQDKLENLIADRILKGDVSRRDTLVYKKGGELVIEKAKEL